MWNRIWNAVTFINRWQDRLFYLPLLALIAAADLFILLVPTDWLIATSVLLQPRRWLKTAMWVACGSSLGAFLLGYLVIHHREWVMQTLHMQSEYGQMGHEHLFHGFDFEAAVEKHGMWALALLSFSIFPQQPGVAIAAMGGMSSFKILAAVFIGRMTKYLIVAYISSRAPNLLVKFHIVPKEHAADVKILEKQSVQNPEHRNV